MSDQLLSKHILSIVGPTATGKTAVALEVAEQILHQKKYQGVTIISADSRQVYTGLETCTGVDIPQSWNKTLQFEKDGYKHPSLPIFLCGVSMILPNEEWSVSHFFEYARPVIAQSIESNFLVVVVGGTGLYQEHLFSNDPALHIPPNKKIRAEVAELSIEDLQKKVEKEAAAAWQIMNNDDRHNPRRLIRALEKATTPPAVKVEKYPLEQLAEMQHLTVGLTDTTEHLAERITQRVSERIELGAVAEVQHLVSTYSDEVWDQPAFTSTGCREIRGYIEGKYELEELKTLWARRETQYAKRQLTWWRSHPFATSFEGFKKKEKMWFDLQDTNKAEVVQTLKLLVY